MADNRLLLAGELTEMAPMRYSPAGVPILEFAIAHQSTQREAGHERAVALRMDAVAAGEVAQSLSRVAAGQPLRVAGFMAQKSRHGRQLVLHVTQFEIS